MGLISPLQSRATSTLGCRKESWARLVRGAYSAFEREHPLLDLRVKSFEILVGAPFELDGPRLCGHEPPCLRMISA